MGTLDRMQERGLFQNLEIHTPPKNHKVKMHKRHKWTNGLKKRTVIMKITTDGRLLSLCPICDEVHLEAGEPYVCA